MSIITNLYRCAKCGSSNVVPYSGDEPLKDALGDILKHKKITVFKCPDCGAELEHAMKDDERASKDQKEMDSPVDVFASGALNKK